MSEKIYQVGIAGASSLLGRELHEELNQSSFAAADLRLLDHEEAAGRLEATDEEIAIVQKIDAEAFDGLDLVFFAGDIAQTEENKNFALSAGASVVDMTAASDKDPEAVVRAPWVEEIFSSPKLLGLQTRLVVPAHPASLMLALLLSRLAGKSNIRAANATFFEPASQLGKEAMDELHQQTLNLMGFQPLPKEQFGEQAAFNMLSSYGSESRHALLATEQRIRRHYSLLSAGRLPDVAVQLVHAPVFHGYTASMMIEFAEEIPESSLKQILADAHIALAEDESDGPNNVAAAGRSDLLVRLRQDSPAKWWLWIAADNLKLASLNAIACAAEMQRMRPVGKVQ